MSPTELQTLAVADLGVGRNDSEKLGMVAKRREEGDENKVPAYLYRENLTDVLNSALR